MRPARDKGLTSGPGGELIGQSIPGGQLGCGLKWRRGAAEMREKGRHTGMYRAAPRQQGPKRISATCCTATALPNVAADLCHMGGQPGCCCSVCTHKFVCKQPHHARRAPAHRGDAIAGIGVVCAAAPLVMQEDLAAAIQLLSRLPQKGARCRGSYDPGGGSSLRLYSRQHGTCTAILTGPSSR